MQSTAPALPNCYLHSHEEQNKGCLRTAVAANEYSYKRDNTAQPFDAGKMSLPSQIVFTLFPGTLLKDEATIKLTGWWC